LLYSGNESIIIAGLGTSHMAGAGLGTEKNKKYLGFVELFGEWLMKSLPSKHITVKNSALPGTTVVYHEICARKLIPEVHLWNTMQQYHT
jgi:hypothetical protein